MMKIFSSKKPKNTEYITRGGIIMKLYAIKDTMAGNFAAPFAAENDNVAKRLFAQEANNPNSRVCVFAKDMDLYRIAEWNVNTGAIEEDTLYLGNALENKEV